MARPIWKGQISFGLVAIPVLLFGGEETSEGAVRFNLLDKANNARIRNQRINEKTGKPVEKENIVKGYELEDGSYITFSEDDLASLAAESNQSVEITDFVDAEAITPSYFDKPYFLLPEKRGRKAYVILRDALKEKNKVGIAKVVIRTRQYLCAVWPEGNGIKLYLLRYPSELREPKADDLPGTAEEVGATPAELDMAQQLIATMTHEFEPGKYRDEYKERFLKWVEERSKEGGERAVEVVSEGDDSEVIDIMSLLKESMAKAKKA
ncbi:MAG: Ku protein [Fimbriimonadaceae bacterium]|nr:Ku protein [Fimbriimonadaceae bacterium]